MFQLKNIIHKKNKSVRFHAFELAYITEAKIPVPYKNQIRNLAMIPVQLPQSAVVFAKLFLKMR